MSIIQWKKIRKIQMILDIENSLWKSDFDTFWWPVSGWIHKVHWFHLSTFDFWPKNLGFWDPASLLGSIEFKYSPLTITYIVAFLLEKELRKKKLVLYEQAISAITKLLITMKVILILWFVFLFSTPVKLDSKYVSLLNLLDMKNPVIVGTTDDFKDRELFVLMKDVMKLNQTIGLTKNVNNTTFQHSPGMIFRSHEIKIAGLYGKNFSAIIQKPWIIIGMVIIKTREIWKKQ